MGLSRVLHWGPLVAIGIIKWVSLATIYCSTMWWPPAASLGGLAFLAAFLALAGLTMYHFLSAMVDGPGYLPLGWTPAQGSAEEWSSSLQWCGECQGYKAPRTHHCRKCARCVQKMDHHCPWINNCVGHFNHGHFAAFLVSAVLGCSLSTICLTMSLYYGLNRSWYHFYGTGSEPVVVLSLWSLLAALFGLGLAIGVVIAVGLLFFFQIRSILRNQTGIEDWIREKADYRLAPTGQTFTWPYDVGRWNNLRQVVGWSCTPSGDGIQWPLAEGATHYTLTREQLRQKEDKRGRTREYQIVVPYSGKWLPLSQGLGVCTHPPCTDEPRIVLQTGERVRVTRWKKYWLYGDKLVAEGQARVRGWFPRRCAVEALDHYDTCQVGKRKEGATEPQLSKKAKESKKKK